MLVFGGADTFKLFGLWIFIPFSGDLKPPAGGEWNDSFHSEFPKYTVWAVVLGHEQNTQELPH